MNTKKRGQRRILSASVGLVAFTAVEGLACGNPVEPPRRLPMDEPAQKPDAAGPLTNATNATDAAAVDANASDGATKK